MTVFTDTPEAMDDPTPNTHMTGRLRLIVRLLDIYADDLGNGTDAERDVAVLLGYVAKAIVNANVDLANDGIRRSGLTQKPRADKLAAAVRAAQVEMDRLDTFGSLSAGLPDSYTGIGG